MSTGSDRLGYGMDKDMMKITDIHFQEISLLLRIHVPLSGHHFALAFLFPYKAFYHTLSHNNIVIRES